MDKNNKRDERQEAYPRPSQTDQQLQNQPEYIDEEPNKFDKEISEVDEKRKNEAEEPEKRKG